MGGRKRKKSERSTSKTQTAFIPEEGEKFVGGNRGGKRGIMHSRTKNEFGSVGKETLGVAEEWVG